MRKKKQQEEFLRSRRCETCDRWCRLPDSEQITGEDVIGECRRYPPKVMVIGDEQESGIIYGLPETTAHFYCGEHTPIEH